MRGQVRVGAPAKGVAHVDSIDGSSLAKSRTKTLLRLIGGELTRQGAASEMGVSVRRVRQLRDVFLTSGVAALEPGEPGRPRHAPPSEHDKRVAQLEAEADMLAWELKTARLAEEIAIVMPSLGQRGRDSGEALGKRRASPRSRRAGRARRAKPR